MVEHAAVNRVVEGSSPSSGAIFRTLAFQWVLNGGKGRLMVKVSKFVSKK